MAKSKATFNKRDKEKKRLQKREEKQLKKEERKANAGSGSFESMLAYVDENGQLTSTPPDPTKRVEIDAESIELGVPRRLESDEVPAERIGKVDFFDSTKGFGFIKEDGTQERFFVHVSGLQEEVREGEKVGFEVERGLKGMNAVRVHKV
jgi:cold shock CspA family protein